MILNIIEVHQLAKHLSDYVENLKDDMEFVEVERGDMERSAANLTEAVQLRELFNEYLLSRS